MVLLAASAAEKLNIGSAAVYALLGYCVVFFGILCLMAVLVVMGKIFVAKANREKAAKAASAPAAAAPTAPAGKPAPGSAGELKLYDTDPKTAAMLMAIVADKLQKPLNELRFKSIKEVK